MHRPCKLLLRGLYSAGMHLKGGFEYVAMSEWPPGVDGGTAVMVLTTRQN